ncbi:protein-export membrane protein SecD [Candidatus Blochmanniella floridana]|uniref:Protein translocase subunit SecD n=1 Tax=Blochmanniella floridana TaxID=203907 RepID=Q7VQA9_BLOFL|nr:protein-export membrane protein SecD [Candidatus Blochmannia floridanus]
MNFTRKILINSFSIWKYVVIFITLMMGFIYAIPNLYKEGFAISITPYIFNNHNLDNVLVSDIITGLKKEEIFSKFVVSNVNKIQICFFSELDQIRAYQILYTIYSERYLVSCTKIPDMPLWLFYIRAKPLKLGLDLKGGLYLLVRVDIQSMLNKIQIQYMDIVQDNLNEKNIVYLKICAINCSDIEIIFKNSDDRNQAISCLSNCHNHLIFNTINDCKLRISFSESYINTMYEYAMQQNSNIIRYRINQLQISDPVIYRYGKDCVIIEIPGIQDISVIKTVLNNTASLEFRLVNTELNQFKINNNYIPEDSEIKLDDNGNIVPIYKKVILTGDHVINANMSFDEYHRPQVNISLDSFGNTIISKFTKDNIGKIMATLFIEYKDTGKKDAQGHSIIYRRDKVINVATIQSQLNHNFCITGMNNLNEVRRLSSLLRMGSLVTPIYVDEEKIIGPTLGKKNIAQGIIACIVGMLISICFMIVWYRYFGLIAGIALVTNFVLIVSLLSVIPGITLTMSSIVGVVLTLSVAIDANVLINERVKEELKQGKPVQYSIYIGYRKACTSIIDANITTIITAIILYIFNTGPIQGFAITTIIGVGTSMFTSIIGTRALVNLVYGKKRTKYLSI